jgi:hypothetical protein
MNTLVKDVVISGFQEAKISLGSAPSAKARIGIGRNEVKNYFLLRF